MNAKNPLHLDSSSRSRVLGLRGADWAAVRLSFIFNPTGGAK